MLAMRLTHFTATSRCRFASWLVANHCSHACASCRNIILPIHLAMVTCSCLLARVKSCQLPSTSARTRCCIFIAQRSISERRALASSVAVRHVSSARLTKRKAIFLRHLSCMLRWRRMPSMCWHHDSNALLAAALRTLAKKRFILTRASTSDRQFATHVRNATPSLERSRLIRRRCTPRCRLASARSCFQRFIADNRLWFIMRYVACEMPRMARFSCRYQSFHIPNATSLS